MASGSVIFAEDLPDKLIAVRPGRSACSASPVSGPGRTLKAQIKEAEQRVIGEVLQRNRGNKAKTAQELGISRRSLQYKIQEYQLD